MRYTLSQDCWGESFSLPFFALDFLAEAREAELKVLLFCASRQTFEEEEVLKAFEDSLSGEEIREALAFWRGAGLFSKKGTKKSREKREKEGEKPSPAVTVISSRPNYTSFDLAAAVDNSPSFKSLVDYAEKRLCKNFNRADLSILYSFVDYLGLGVDVVMLAIEACAKEGKKNLRYIEKLLCDLVDRGICEYEEADAYFVRREEYLSFEGQIRALCGFGSRALTAAEKKILTSWREEKNYTEEEIRAAYEKTVNTIAKPSVSYMNKVLSTLREEPASHGQTQKTYDTEGRFAAAVARTKKKKQEAVK